MGEDTTWSLSQAPVEELQHRSLDFWSKSMPSAVENYTPFEKRVFQPPALIEMEYLTMRHRGTKPPEEFVLSWAPGDHQVIRWRGPSPNHYTMQVGHPGSRMRKAGEHNQAARGSRSRTASTAVLLPPSTTSFSLSSHLWSPGDPL